MSKNRKLVPHEIRQEVFAETDRHCVYCGRSETAICNGMPHNGDKKNFLTVDHIIPVSSGGSNKAWNLITACAICNSRRGLLYPVSAHVRPKYKTLAARKEAYIFIIRQTISKKAQDWLQEKYSAPYLKSISRLLTYQSQNDLPKLRGENKHTHNQFRRREQKQ